MFRCQIVFLFSFWEMQSDKEDRRTLMTNKNRSWSRKIISDAADRGNKMSPSFVYVGNHLEKCSKGEKSLRIYIYSEVLKLFTWLEWFHHTHSFLLLTHDKIILFLPAYQANKNFPQWLISRGPKTVQANSYNAKFTKSPSTSFPFAMSAFRW